MKWFFCNFVEKTKTKKHPDGITPITMNNKRIFAMKKILLLSFIVALFVGSASAQESTLKLVQEGRSWHTVSLMPLYNNTDYEGEENFYKDISGKWCKANSHNYYVIKGDTIING